MWSVACILQTIFIKKFVKAIKNPKKVILCLEKKGMFNFLPDSMYLKMFYYLKTNNKLNLKTPISFNEKLQWLKLHYRNPYYANLVDKYEVRKHVKRTIGEEYLIPLLGVYDTFEEIDFDKLPNQFVLKCTHDSGGLVICHDKSQLNIKRAKKKINKCLRRNYYYLGREWVYKDINPRIVCESLMVDESGVELKDYKFFCFSGEPKIIQVDFSRFTNHKRNFYNLEWDLLDLSIKYPNDPNTKIIKPDKLEEMIKLASKLSSDYPHVRVDFYYIKGQIYFGEITFFHGSGYESFQPEKYNDLLGSWIKLPD